MKILAIFSAILIVFAFYCYSGESFNGGNMKNSPQDTKPLIRLQPAPSSDFLHDDALSAATRGFSEEESLSGATRSFSGEDRETAEDYWEAKQDPSHNDHRNSQYGDFLSYVTFAYQGSVRKAQYVPSQKIESDKVNRIVIYTASLVLQVINVDETVDKLKTFVESRGGYIQSTTNTQTVIRIPVPYFEQVIQLIESIGIVYDKQIISNDITEEYLDKTIRLNNKLAYRNRLLQHLKNTKKIEESVEIEQKLSEVTEEIEALKGRLNYLMNQAQFSTIRIGFRIANDNRQRRYFNSPYAWVRTIGIDTLLNH